MGTPTEELIAEYKEIIAKLEAEKIQLVEALKLWKECADEHDIMCHCGRDARDAALKAAGEEV